MEIINTLYTAEIEKIIVENIRKANISIYIAVAWFTSNNIKNALLNRKDQVPALNIEIVVDDNLINEKYFFDYEEKFKKAKIKIHSKSSKRFLHTKFMLVDGIYSISGSYNFTNKARNNSEQVVKSNSVIMHNYLLKTFKFLTDSAYIDENLLLLLKYPEFGRSIISTFYKFTKIQYHKFQDKISSGYCFKVDNGNWDVLHRRPGLLFNPNIKFTPDLGVQDFDFPITKEKLQDWTKSRNMGVILEYYQDKPDLYQYINDELDENAQRVMREFYATLESIFDAKELEKLIISEPDIVVEDYIWITSFLPFINKNFIDSFFSNVEPLPKVDAADSLVPPF